MAKVRTKDEFLRLLGLGLLGNRMPSWDSPEEAREGGYHGPVMVRYREANSPFMRPDVPMDRVPDVIDGLVAIGADREKFYLTHMTPHVGRLINAEAYYSDRGFYLHYSFAQTHLREALDVYGRHAEGVKARMILEACCCPNSVDDLRDLWNIYPDAVIELTAYDREIGNIPGRNTIVWEVRDY